MKSVSKTALAASLIICGAELLLALPAAAQPVPMAPQAPRTFTLSRAEQAAMQPLQAALDARNYALAQGALPAARSAAQSADARYVAAQLQLRLGLDTQNVQMQREAIDALIESGGAQASELPLLYQNQAALWIAAGNRDRAEAALTRSVELNPNNPLAIVQLAEMKVDRNRPAEAVPLYMRALGIMQASGQRPPESWLRRAARLAFDYRAVEPTLSVGRMLVAIYPSQLHWRDVLLNYREVTQADEQMTLDLYRLMRAAGALTGERDYQEMATLLQRRGLHGEASAVLEQGVSRRHLDTSKAALRDLITTTGRAATQGRAGLAAAQRAATTGPAAITAADQLFGYGRYAEAATLYRTALTQAGVDTGLVNTRLGASLALAGQAAEAQAAFGAVAGPRAPLAQYWLAWLANRPATAAS